MQDEFGADAPCDITRPGVVALLRGLQGPRAHRWLTAQATDNLGARTTSEAKVVTVLNNAAPEIELVTPVPGESFALGAPITLSATASDAEVGFPSKVEFFAGMTLLGSDTTPPYAYTWTNAAMGTHSITAKATDNHPIWLDSSAHLHRS